MPHRRISDEITSVAGIGSAIARHAQSHGIDIAPICQALNIDPDNFQSLTERISLDRLCRLLETCALLTGNDAFGLECAATFIPGSTGPFGYGLMTAPTLRDLLRFTEDHIYYATNTSDFRLVISERQTTVSWTFAPIIAKRDQYVDMSVALMFQRFRTIIGKETDHLEIEFERPKPRNLQVFKEALARKIEFSSRLNVIHISSNVLDIPNPKADARLFELMDLQCAALRAQAALGETQFVDQVRRYMEMRVAEHDLSLTQIAPYFSLSERTFQRRLSDAGTNLNDIRDDVRRQASLQLLTRSDLPIADICYRLGYSAPSAFSRSVSRWFGQSPKTMRLRAKDSTN
jgi:AraC-like DNA-binding protein